MDPISIGLLATGGLGMLKGMFDKTPQVSVPSMDELRRQNPELYEQLMAMSARARAMSAMADRRGTGLTPAQQMVGQEQTGQIREQLANRGLVGSSAGTGMMADAGSRIYANLLESALKEKMALEGAAMNAQGQFGGAFNQAISPYMQAQGANAQSKAADQGAQNQFFSGLFNGGLGMYGANQYAQNQDALMKKYFGASAPNPNVINMSGGNGVPYAMSPIYDEANNPYLLPPQITPRNLF